MRWILGSSIAVIVTVGGAGTAWACGAYFDSDLSVGVAQTADQRILVVDNGAGSSELIFQVGYDGTDPDFSWVVPTPAAMRREDVEVIDAGVFEELHAVTEPKLVWLDAGCTMYGCGGSGSEASSTGTVSLFDAFSTGGFEFSVVSATDASDLTDWLNTNGYVVPASATPVIGSYVDRNFAFLAMKVSGASHAAPTYFDPDSSEERPGAGSALKLRMPRRTLSIPLMISSISTSREVELLVYVLADQRWEVTSFPTVDVDASGIYRGHKGDFDAYYLDRLHSQLRTDQGVRFGTEYYGYFEVTDHLPSEFEGNEGPLYPDPGLTRNTGMVTRLRTFIAPEEMDRDIDLAPLNGDKADEPYWVRIPHGGAGVSAMRSVPWDLILLAGIFAMRRQWRRR